MGNMIWGIGSYIPPIRSTISAIGDLAFTVRPHRGRSSTVAPFR